MAFKEAIARVAGIACCRRRRCCGFGASAMAAVFVFLLSSSRTNRRPTLGKRDRPTTKKGAQMDDRARKRLGFFLEPIFPFSFFFGIVPRQEKKACPWRRCLGANLRMRHTHIHHTKEETTQRAMPCPGSFFFLALWFLGHLGHSVFAGRRLRDERQSKSGRKKICGRHCNKQKKDGQTRRGRALGFWGIHSKLLFILFFCPQCAPPPAKERQASGEGKEKKGDTMGRSTGAANGGPLL
ncbi:hypothetical protein TW95_gp1577 [Pandoravirus inopinatum]|uniref:Uncharacterized protein n=1 Tax=Pandoravirus inopinatum TaxID=1605721 RepID=A0A0B5JBC8_9VIRU|nr:hypothetical protein TW95_gp1577 [Pandoravirus inopinatum]AJF98311.1 hypothetical protein [Pandoravirus inopinatum]